jgi:hypothetical protein
MLTDSELAMNIHFKLPVSYVLLNLVRLGPV